MKLPLISRVSSIKPKIALSTWVRKWRMFLPKKYHATDRTAADYSIISVDPPIFYVKRWIDENLVFDVCYDLLYEYLRTKSCYFICSWRSSIDRPKQVDIIKHFEDRHIRRYPKHRFIHFCDTTIQEKLFRQKKLNAVFCNQNALIDENIFQPLPNTVKRYDAIYDARLLPLKRHYLASEIDKLGLVYAYNPIIDDRATMEKIKKQVSHASFFNDFSTESYKKLDPSEINEYLNQCRVGLCLSAKEGAMYASIQYLLSGLPVVSTKSQGGRDVFFDDRFVTIVDDNPADVKKAVQELILRNISPDFVRDQTLKKVRHHRNKMISVIQEIYTREKVNRDFAKEWKTVYFNKMYQWQKHAEAIYRIATTQASD